MWFEEIDNNLIIPREFLHTSFISSFYGIIPLELTQTFPMGQYESIDILEIDDMVNKTMIRKILNFFKIHGQHYDKCGILSPVNYINQFNEIIEFSKDALIKRIVDLLKFKFNLNVSAFKEIFQILQFFKNERK
jgi:predicted RNA-binding protein